MAENVVKSENTELNYANHIGWSDVEPFEILSRTTKTITIRRMKAERDPSWKPEVVLGGFSGITVNNCDQKWIITSDESETVLKAYLRKDGYYHSRLGKHALAASPRKFYDYNF